MQNLNSDWGAINSKFGFVNLPNASGSGCFPASSSSSSSGTLINGDDSSSSSRSSGSEKIREEKDYSAIWMLMYYY